MTRKEREKTIIGQMIRMYCEAFHSSGRGMLCQECEELLGYASVRIDRCPMALRKSSCRKCEIHCYSPTHRDRIRRVMRYAGPRMLVRHPLSAIYHIYNEIHR